VRGGGKPSITRGKEQNKVYFMKIGAKIKK
jgi:hypothetical protein